MTQNKIVGEVILKIRDRKKLLEECLSLPFDIKIRYKWEIYNQISFLDDICYDLLVSIPTMGEDKGV